MAETVNAEITSLFKKKKKKKKKSIEMTLKHHSDNKPVYLSHFLDYMQVWSYDKKTSQQEPSKTNTATVLFSTLAEYVLFHGQVHFF